MLNIQNYIKVESLDEAYELNQKKNNKIIGGMMWMRMGDSRINTAIDLSGLGLDKIEENDDEFRIGCMVTLRQLEVHDGFNQYTGGCVKEALRHIVGVQFRNLATVGGSIFGRGARRQNKVVVFDRGGHGVGEYVRVRITGCSSATLFGEEIK